MSESSVPFLVDAHLHPLPGHSAATFATLAKQLRVSQLILNGSQEKDWPQVHALANSQAEIQIFPFYGLHPWYGREKEKNWMELLRQFSSHAAGIGEIGLDTRHGLPHSEENSSLQQDVFRQQLALAQSLSRPVTIHCVRAWHLLLPILREMLRHHPVPLLLHGYNASEPILSQLLPFPVWFSLGERFFRQNPEKARAVLSQIPPERLLLESDATTVEAFSQLPGFYEKIACYEGLSLQKLGGRMEENLLAYLHAANSL
ncbi:MAG: TatD family hydrolase [Planctomycetia bacterium]|nr:TatD family hydrolase [Planctomycetia bacterium]